MKKIIILLLFALPLISAGPRVIIGTIESSCTVCNTNTVYFTGSGYTPGKTIAVTWENSLRNGWITFNACTVDASGNISFEVNFIGAETYTVRVFQSKAKNRFDFVTSEIITIQ